MIYDTVVEILQCLIGTVSFIIIHYRFLSQVLIIALYRENVILRSETLDDKPGVELQFIVGGGQVCQGELQGARHAVSLMAETHTELLRLLLEQSRYFQF